MTKGTQRVKATDKPAGTLPKVLMVVTGKGPLKEKYMTEISRRQSGVGGGDKWQWIRCISLWLEAEDYPLLLGEMTSVRESGRN